MRTVLARTLTALVTGLALLVLSGCFKIDMDLEVSSNDTVNGSMVFAFDKEFAEEFGEEAASGLDLDPDDFTKDGGEAEVEPYAEGDWVGEKVTFTDVPLASFNEGLNEDDTSGDEFNLRREGDTFVFDGTFDATEEGMTADSGLDGMDDLAPDADGSEESPFEDDEFEDMMGGMAEMMMGQAEIRFSITFPGKVLETNGEVDGRTVTWTPKFGEKAEMHAKAAAAGGGSGDGDGAGSGLLLGVGAGVAVLLLLLLWLLLRRRSSGGRTDAPQPPAGHTAPTTYAGAANPGAGGPAAGGPVQAPTTPTGVQPGWYPTPDGQYRWHDGNDWTEHTRPAPEA